VLRGFGSLRVPPANRLVFALPVWLESLAGDETARPLPDHCGDAKSIRDIAHRPACSAVQVAVACRYLIVDIDAPIHAYIAVVLGICRIATDIQYPLGIACIAAGIRGPLVIACTAVGIRALTGIVDIDAAPHGLWANDNTNGGLFAVARAVRA
jgi:hypothetical protein